MIFGPRGTCGAPLTSPAAPSFFLRLGPSLLNLLSADRAFRVMSRPGPSYLFFFRRVLIHATAISPSAVMPATKIVG